MNGVPTPEKIGARMRRRRKALKLKQVELARRVGIDRHRMNRLESGARQTKPDLVLLSRVAKELDTSLAALLGV